MANELSAKRRKRVVRRPEAGLQAGKRSSDYPRLTVGVRQRVVDLLEQMVANEERPQWKVLADAIGERADRVLKSHRPVMARGARVRADSESENHSYRTLTTGRQRLEGWLRAA